MAAKDKILDILQQAYQIEINGYTFYSMTADKCDKPATKELFQKLAHDEIQHQNYLTSVGKKYQKEGVKGFATTKKSHSMDKYVSEVFTDRFVEQAKGTTFEMGALSVGMTLETNAMALFHKAQAKADSKEVKEFYLFLEEWEKEHFDALKHLFDQLRGDFWGEGGFSPF
jgi:rubrerythrin